MDPNEKKIYIGWLVVVTITALILLVCAIKELRKTYDKVDAIVNKVDSSCIMNLNANALTGGSSVVMCGIEVNYTYNEVRKTGNIVIPVNAISIPKEGNPIGNIYVNRDDPDDISYQPSVFKGIILLLFFIICCIIDGFIIEKLRKS